MRKNIFSYAINFFYLVFILIAYFNFANNERFIVDDFYILLIVKKPQVHLNIVKV
jgi:hypothetical protein